MGVPGSERRGQSHGHSWRLGLVAVMVGLLVAVAAAAAASASLRQAERRATAVILLHPLEGNAYSPGGRGDDLTNLETEAQVLRSDAVARAVLEELGVRGEPSELLADISVAVPPNTQLLAITARGADVDAAVSRASAFADVYLAFRRARTESAIFERTSRLEELVLDREDERAAAGAALARLSSTSPKRALVQQQIQELVVQISSLREQLAAAQAVARAPGQLVTPGRLVAPSPWTSPVRVGTVGGLAAACLVLFLGVARRGRKAPDLIWCLDDIAGADGPRPLGALRSPVRADSDEIALLRSAVLAVGPGRQLVVTVAPLADGRTTTFPALVDSFAHARYQVVAVDLTEPADVAAMAELVVQAADVADVLIDEGDFRSRLRPLLAPTSGTLAGFRDLAASAGLRNSLADLAKGADLVLVRAPGFATPVGRAMLAAATAVVVEIVPGVNTRSDLEELVIDASLVDTAVVGVVEVAALLPARKARGVATTVEIREAGA